MGVSTINGSKYWTPKNPHPEVVKMGEVAVYEITKYDGKVIEFCRQGGSFVEATNKERWFSMMRSYPQQERQWRSALVMLDDGRDSRHAPIYRCYIQDGVKWNGWEWPMFELDQVERIVQYVYGVRWGDDGCVVIDFPNSSDEPDIVKPEAIVVDGKPKQVWGVGAGWFLWVRVAMNLPSPSPSPLSVATCDAYA